MIKFIKERFLAVLFLSVIFTFSSLFWTSDAVYNQEDLSSIELGWPVKFAVQDHSQLSPPEWWFPNEIGLGLPQEYPIGFYTNSFIIDIVFNFILIFSLIFIILKTYPNSKILSELIKARYIAGFTVAIFALFVFYMIFSSNTNQLRRGVGVPPQAAEKIITPESNSNINIFKNNPNIPGKFESNKLGFSFKYPSKYKDVSYFITDNTSEDSIYSGRIFHGSIFKNKCTGPPCFRWGISLTGMTPDYSAPRGGSPTDNLGYIKRNGKYFIIRVGGVETEIFNTVEEIKTATAEGILIIGEGVPVDGPGLGWNEGTLLAVFNLKKSKFGAINFYTSNASNVSEKDFMQIINSVDIYGYDGNKVLSTYRDAEYDFEIDYPSYLKVEVTDDEKIKMTESFGQEGYTINRSIKFQSSNIYSGGFLIRIFKKPRIFSLDEWLKKENNNITENPFNAKYIIDKNVFIDKYRAIIIHLENDIEVYPQKKMILLKDGVLFEVTCGVFRCEDLKSRIKFN